MTPQDRASDGRVYWGPRPADFAQHCVEHAATHGFRLELRPETPILPDNSFPQLERRTTWAEIEALVRELGDVGCDWVNLRFALDESGNALVRYERQTTGRAPA